MSKAKELIEAITKRDWGNLVSIHSEALGRSVMSEATHVYKDHGGSFRFSFKDKKFSQFADSLDEADNHDVTFKATTHGSRKLSGVGRISDMDLIVTKSSDLKDLLKYVTTGTIIM